jgi:two-component system response regulator ResD
MGTEPDMGTIRVLVAEDDRAIRELLVHHLERDGFTPIESADGQSTLRAAREGVDLVLLDIGLPGVDGFEIARTLRREGRSVPIVMLTARTDEVDRVVGFELGADDYVVKPFSPREVIARVRAILRRSGSKHEPGPQMLRFGRLEIDESAREARVDGHDVGLKPREYALLLQLASNPGVALSRDVLLERVGLRLRRGRTHGRRTRAPLADAFGRRTPSRRVPAHRTWFWLQILASVSL